MRQIELFRNLKHVLLLIAIFTFAVPSNAQFPEKKKPQGVIDDDPGGGGKSGYCVEPGGTWSITLALSQHAADIWATTETVGWGCDLYIGITSSQGETSYTYAGNHEDYNYESHELEIDDSRFDNDTSTNNPNPDNVFTGLYGYVDCTLPQVDIIKDKVDCIEATEYNNDIWYYDLSLSVNLYCKEGDDFVPVNPCDHEDFFHMELVDGCNLESGLDLKICCDSRGFEEDLGFGMVKIDTEDMLSAGFSVIEINNHGFQYEIRGEYEQKLKYTIFDIRGLEIEKGDLYSKEGYQYQSLDNLSSGMYILTLKDHKGEIESKKFFRI